MKGEMMIDKAIISIATMACALSWCSSGPRYRKVNISTEALVQDRKKANEDSFSLDETAKICEDHINHAVVVYGYYEDDYLLCHFGWTRYTQVKMSKLGLLYRSGTLAIYNQTMHQHRYYFVDSLTGDHVCGCGWVLEDEED